MMGEETMLNKITHERGQALVEYTLVTTIIGLGLIVGLMLFGTQIAALFDHLTEQLTTNGIDVAWAPETTRIQTIQEDFRSRTLDYYNDKGRWPHARNPRNYTDLGLDPDDWCSPGEGLRWISRRDTIRMKNVKGDNIQVYVDDMNGNTLHLYDGWNILCPVTENSCYYHTIDPGNKVDISTIQIVEE